MWTATSEVEQAVCTATLGPRRFSLYETVVGRWSLSFDMATWKDLAYLTAEFPLAIVNYRGVGSGLMQRGLDDLRAYGFEDVALWVLDGNAPAIDGEVDLVNCGTGADTAQLDSGDLLADSKQGYQESNRLGQQFEGLDPHAGKRRLPAFHPLAAGAGEELLQQPERRIDQPPLVLVPAAQPGDVLEAVLGEEAQQLELGVRARLDAAVDLEDQLLGERWAGNLDADRQAIVRFSGGKSHNGQIENVERLGIAERSKSAHCGIANGNFERIVWISRCGSHWRDDDRRRFHPA